MHYTTRSFFSQAFGVLCFVLRFLRHSLRLSCKQQAKLTQRFLSAFCWVMCLPCTEAICYGYLSSCTLSRMHYSLCVLPSALFAVPSLPLSRCPSHLVRRSYMRIVVYFLFCFSSFVCFLFAWHLASKSLGGALCCGLKLLNQLTGTGTAVGENFGGLLFGAANFLAF